MTYTGTIDGGGTVAFTLSLDGAKVTAFDATWPACPQGTFHVNLLNLGVPPPTVSAGKFTFGDATFATITGQLLANRMAEGTLADYACKGSKLRRWHATGTATAGASAAPASPPNVAAASVTFRTGKASVKVAYSGTVLSLAEPLGSGEVGGNRFSASWDDRVKGGGLIGTELKLGLPPVSGTYANTGGFEGVFIAIKHLSVASETDKGTSQSCHVVIDPTSTGGIAGTLDCTGTNVSMGSYTARGTFSAEP